MGSGGWVAGEARSTLMVMEAAMLLLPGRVGEAGGPGLPEARLGAGETETCSCTASGNAV